MRRTASLALPAALLATVACSTYDDDGYGGYRYEGSRYDMRGNDCGYFGGSGGDRLDPWLACTREGQEIVRHGFDGDDDRRLGAKAAMRANIWFRRHADTDRDLCLTDPEIRAALVNGSRHYARY